MSHDPLSHYSLGASDAEHRRLVELARHEEGQVREACARAGIGPGAVVFDLGCGPLGALSALAGVVGPAGRIVGVDASGAALEKARRYMTSRGIETVELIESDVHDVDPATAGDRGADLAYCRLMLLHQEDPSATLRHMARLLRPGGAVIAHEASDLAAHAPASEPPVPAMTRVWELVIGAARARGANPEFARNGRRHLEAAGLEVESQRAYVVHYPPSIGYDIPRVALHSLRPTLAHHGLASAAEIDALDAELEAAKQHPEVQWVSSPLMFEWIARKPAHEK
jgi:ubiquinone/menaquinone biosynthesis C-methylase UbiE